MPTFNKFSFEESVPVLDEEKEDEEEDDDDDDDDEDEVSKAEEPEASNARPVVTRR